VIAKNMLEKMSKDSNEKRFVALQISKRSSIYLGVRTCARFNRGESCHQGEWHTTHRPEALWTRHGAANMRGDEMKSLDQQEKKNDMRLHSCTLCLEALGAAYGHSVLNCSWIFKKNWEDD